MAITDKMNKWDALLAFAIFLTCMGGGFLGLGAWIGNDVLMATGGQLIFSIIAYYFGHKNGETKNGTA